MNKHPLMYWMDFLHELNLTVEVVMICLFQNVRHRSPDHDISQNRSEIKK